MRDYPYLHVTFRDGRFLAAYLYLAEPRGQRRPKTRRLSDSVLLDIDEEGNPVGIEILSREGLDAEKLNVLLKPFGVRPIEQRELATAA